MAPAQATSPTPSGVRSRRPQGRFFTAANPHGPAPITQILIGPIAVRAGT